MENNTSLQQQLLEAGVHFGHLKKKWNPKMLPYIYAEKKGIPNVIIMGSEELAKNECTVKNIITGKQTILSLGDLSSFEF